jgi:hypothetical protein
MSNYYCHPGKAGGLPISIYQIPSKFNDDKSFDDQLNAFILDSLPEGAKRRVVDKYERLKPSARKPDDDKANLAFWAELARQSSNQPTDSATLAQRRKALANRLELIGCVAEGAPYVARNLARARLSAKGDDSLGEEGAEVIKHFSEASLAGGRNCPGAKGFLVGR